MDEHHVCRWPLWHRVVVCGSVVIWILGGALSGIPLLAQALTHSSTWFFGSMLLALMPGTVFVQILTRWRCQPVPRAGLRPLDYAALALPLLRDLD